MKLDRNKLPEPVLEKRPDLIVLYWTAWELAWKNVTVTPGMPRNPYMNEAFAEDRIWIWDTCFMVHFCKYAPDLFPGVESLENFYQPMYDGASTPLLIHHPDNPPLFAWVEYAYYRFTGDASRIRRVIAEKRYLQRHYEFLETLDSGSVFPWGGTHTNFKKLPDGYMWSGNPSGMDNTPRARNEYDSILWLDAISQQALNALYISRLASVIGEDADARLYLERYETLKETVNRHYWCEEDHTYYDHHISYPCFSKVLTPVSFWPLMAEVASAEQAAKLVEMTRQPDKLGGLVPWPSVARDDPDFNPKGCYWRGGVWLPTSYMVTKALEHYGYLDLAAETAEPLLNHMTETYQLYSPHTIWEAYSPTRPEPASIKISDAPSRPDFCGWSALGPISMLIENVLGFYDVDATERRIRWHKHRTDRHGIKRLQFGQTCTDILADGDTVVVQSNQPYTLEINGVAHACGVGETRI